MFSQDINALILIELGCVWGAPDMCHFLQTCSCVHKLLQRDDVAVVYNDLKHNYTRLRSDDDPQLTSYDLQPLDFVKRVLARNPDSIVHVRAGQLDFEICKRALPNRIAMVSALPISRELRLQCWLYSLPIKPYLFGQIDANMPTRDLNACHQACIVPHRIFKQHRNRVLLSCLLPIPLAIVFMLIMLIRDYLT